MVECGEAFLGYGLKAAASGAPFYVLPKHIAASDCASNNALYKTCRDPFSGEEVICVPALRPDVALLHVPATDHWANLRRGPMPFMDSLLGRAAKRIIASCRRSDRLRSCLPTRQRVSAYPDFWCKP